MSAEPRVPNLAVQADAIARRQGAGAGIAPHTMRNRARCGHWQRLQRGVYATFSGEPTRETVLWAALLRAGPGAVLSHQTAAERHGLVDEPSQMITHAGQQFFYCFGCQATGDLFSFVGKIENVGFPEAVRIVAQKCGIPLPKREFSSPEEAAGARLRAKLLELHETAAAWFEEQLRGPGGASAREYLAGRGMTEEGIKKFRIGYAPDSFNALRDRLSGMADQETLRASGLFSSKEQGDGSQGPIYDDSGNASCFLSATRAVE